MNVGANIFEPLQLEVIDNNQMHIPKRQANQSPFHLEINAAHQTNNFEHSVPIHSAINNSCGHLNLVQTNNNNPQNNDKIEVPIIPQKFDVLCGKEKLCIDHEGSRHFRKVIDLYRRKYQQCTAKHEKMLVTKEIYDNLQQNTGSRFLRYSAKSESWEEVTEIVARDKISHALRFARLKQNKQQRQQGKEDKRQQEEQQQKINSICIGNERNIIPQSLSTFSWISSYSLSELSGRATKTTPLSSSKEEEKPQRTSAAQDENQATRATNPSTMLLSSDPGPMIGTKEEEAMWNLFVQQQLRDLKRETIEGKTAPVVAAPVTASPPISIGEDDFPSKIIDEEQSDWIMKEPLLDIDVCSIAIDEEDCNSCSSDMFPCSMQFDSENDCRNCSSLTS